MGRPLKFESPEHLQDLIKFYFQSCDENKKPYTITGLALALDTSRETLINYEKREEYFDTIKRAKLRCQNYADERLFEAKQVAGVIFNLKNNYGWVDKTETDITTKGKEIGSINFPVKNE